MIQETLATLGPEPLPAFLPSTESDSECDKVEDPSREPVVGWHNDSYREALPRFTLGLSDL